MSKTKQKPKRITPLDRSVRTERLARKQLKNGAKFYARAHHIWIMSGVSHVYLTKSEARELVRWLTTPQEVK